MFGILFTLMLIEQRNDTTHHFTAGIITGDLRNRDHHHTVLFEFTFVDPKLDTVSKKAA
ncbi:MAG: hypothetical protein Q8M99_11355 [Methylotenera sp.]|nr:hypothetical protein [Methylotenera sp.]